MKKLFLQLVFLAAGLTQLPAQTPAWTVTAESWPESFGSQRAEIEVRDPAASVGIDLYWRRHDGEIPVDYGGRPL